MTSLLAVTGRCCIAGTKTRPGREEEEEEEGYKKRIKQEEERKKGGERKTTAHVQLVPRQRVPADTHEAERVT